MANTQYLTALLLVAVTIGKASSLSTGDFFADTFLTTIRVDCANVVSVSKCFDWMLGFKWPLSGDVTLLTKPSLQLDEGTTSYVLFNVNNRANWMNIAYHEPKKPGFSLVISHDVEKGDEGTDVAAKSDTLSMSLGNSNLPKSLPCPGSPLGSNCTMTYFAILLSYTGMNDTFSK